MNIGGMSDRSAITGMNRMTGMMTVIDANVCWIGILDD
jgi:hypothetical protein